MKLINYLSNKIPAFGVLIALLVLSSCGSYQYVGQTSDGIYGTTNENVEQAPVAAKPENNNDYYTNYFKDKAQEAEIYNQSDDVFTDIDSYQGTYDETLDAQNQNGGWGATNENVVINVYDNGWNNFGWGWDYPWGWNSTWAWNRPWGWNAWGWNAGWGWNNPWGWNYGWGWNAGFGFGSWNAWCPPYYGNGFYGNNYYRRGIAFNAGRRGGLARRGNSILSPRNNSLVRPRTNNSVRPRTNNTVRPRTSTSTRPRSTTRPRSNTSVPRPRTNTSAPRSRPRPRTNTSSPRPRTNTSTPRPRTNNSAPRSSAPRASSPSRGGGSRGGGVSSGGRRGRR